MNNPRPEFGTFHELRRHFGIPRTTAYELKNAGEIRFIRDNQFGRILKRCEQLQMTKLQ